MKKIDELIAIYNESDLHTTKITRLFDFALSLVQDKGEIPGAAWLIDQANQINKILEVYKSIVITKETVMTTQYVNAGYAGDWTDKQTWSHESFYFKFIYPNLHLIPDNHGPR